MWRNVVNIYPTEGCSYANDLSNIKLEDTEMTICAVRKLKTGAILIEMGKGGRRHEFRVNLKSVLKQEATVNDIT